MSRLVFRCEIRVGSDRYNALATYCYRAVFQDEPIAAHRDDCAAADEQINWLWGAGVDGNRVPQKEDQNKHPERMPRPDA